MPKISVIVPVYNVEKYLRQCIDSILAQTFADFELILVDDGSTDKCGAICDEYAKKDYRIKVIHQKNGGLSAARNAGLDIAAGNYVAFIDSDDLVRDRYLEVLYNALIESESDISTCRSLVFDDGDDKGVCPYSGSGEKMTISGKDACLSIYIGDGRTHVVAWGKLYRKALFKNIRYPLSKIHEDDAVTPIVFYHANKVTICEDCLYMYRTRDGSIMNQKFSAKRFECIEAIDNCISFFAEKEEPEILNAAYVFREKTRSLYIISACHSGIKKMIPKQYRCSEAKAILNLYKILADEKFDWYIYPFHPKLIHLISYLRKISKLIHIKK